MYVVVVAHGYAQLQLSTYMESAAHGHAQPQPFTYSAKLQLPTYNIELASHGHRTRTRLALATRVLPTATSFVHTCLRADPKLSSQLNILPLTYLATNYRMHTSSWGPAPLHGPTPVQVKRKVRSERRQDQGREQGLL